MHIFICHELSITYSMFYMFSDCVDNGWVIFIYQNKEIEQGHYIIWLSLYLACTLYYFLYNKRYPLFLWICFILFIFWALVRYSADVIWNSVFLLLCTNIIFNGLSHTHILSVTDRASFVRAERSQGFSVKPPPTHTHTQSSTQHLQASGQVSLFHT